MIQNLSPLIGSTSGADQSELPRGDEANLDHIAEETDSIESRVEDGSGNTMKSHFNGKNEIDKGKKKKVKRRMVY